MKHDQKDKRTRVSGRDAPHSRAGTQGGDAQRLGLGAGGGDAPPSNTASHNSNPEYFKPLRWGTDSLYVSYPGELSLEVEAQLKNLKQLAQDPDPSKQSQAQFPLGSHLFEVKDRGAKRFPYLLEDNTFRIQLSRPSKSLPMAYVKIASGYLSSISPADAEKTLYALVADLGQIKGSPNVSRIDLFVDFVSFEDMESWTRHAWVTRATGINTYAVDGKFSGWSIGMGGILSARLYNKVLEIEKSGKHYLFDLWRKAGWIEGEPVWRLEFEFKREALTQRGLSSLDQVLGNLNGLWSYAMTEWLRLTLPNPEDQTRSRWPIHPLWGYLSSIDWETDGGPLTPRHSDARLPDKDRLFSMGLHNLLTFMASEGMTDLYQGQEAFITALYRYHEEKAHQLGLSFDKYIADKVALKNREFNTVLNNPDLEEERKALERKRQAEAYRKAADGE
jgi:hypothetical protein